MTDAGGGAVNLSYSNGGGVQSTAMLCLVASGDLPPGPFLFANVGADSEHPDTLAYIANHARPFAAAHGIEMVELHKARKGERDTVRQALERGRMVIPVRRSAGGPPMSRSCTAEFKIGVIGKELKRRGATTDDPWRVCIGISVDELERAKPGVDPRAPWQVRTYPLLDLGLRRADCLAVIADAGLPLPPKSSCFFCPFHSLETWRTLREKQPDLFAESVAIEAKMSAATTDGRPVFLTRYGVPLDQAVTVEQRLFDPDDDGCDEGFCMT